MLQVTNEQMTALSASRLAKSHRRIMAYLREVAPEHVEGMADEDLLLLIQEADRKGRELGLRSERAHGKFAYLWAITEGGIARDSQFITYIGEDEAWVEILLEDLFEDLDVVFEKQKEN